MAKKKKKTLEQKQKAKEKKQRREQRQIEEAERLAKEKQKKRNKKVFIGGSILAGLSLITFGLYTALKKPKTLENNKPSTVYQRNYEQEDPKYAKLSSLEKKVLKTAEKISQKTLEKGWDYNFYDNSERIILYLPDKHIEEIRGFQKLRLKNLSQELKKQRVKIAGLGLEGFVKGVSTQKIKETRNYLMKKNNRFSESVIEENANLLKAIFAKLKSFKQEGLLTEELFKEFNEIFLKGVSALTDARNNLYHAYPDSQKISSATAPGGPFCDVIDVPLFGLENRDFYDTILKKTSMYSLVLGLKYAYDIIKEAVKKDMSFLKPVITLYENAGKKLEKELLEYETLLPENVVKNFKKGINEKGISSLQERFDKEISAEDRPRTYDWIKNIPDNLKSLVVIIGGQSHTHYLKEYCDKTKQSYIVLPELD